MKTLASLLIWLMMSFDEGNGWTGLCMYLLSSEKSETRHSFPFFFPHAGSLMKNAGLIQSVSSPVFCNMPSWMAWLMIWLASSCMWMGICLVVRMRLGLMGLSSISVIVMGDPFISFKVSPWPNVPRTSEYCSWSKVRISSNELGMAAELASFIPTLLIHAGKFCNKMLSLTKSCQLRMMSCFNAGKTKRLVCIVVLSKEIATLTIPTQDISE